VSRYSAFFASALLVLAACHSKPSSPSLPIEPKTLNDVEPIDLPAQVLDALPQAGTTAFRWNDMLQAPIIWTSNGFTRVGPSMITRDG